MKTWQWDGWNSGWRTVGNMSWAMMVEAKKSSIGQLQGNQGSQLLWSSNLERVLGSICLWDSEQAKKDQTGSHSALDNLLPSPWTEFRTWSKRGEREPPESHSGGHPSWAANFVLSNSPLLPQQLVSMPGYGYWFPLLCFRPLCQSLSLSPKV